MKIGIFGSAAGEIKPVFEKARELGEILASENVTIITGASTGIPYQAAYAAYKKGAAVWGYSPSMDYKSHIKDTGDDVSIYKKLIYVSRDFQYGKNILVTRKYRNVLSTANCDAGIIISGRWGTLNEFTNLFDMGKVIGVLTGTGGVANELKSLSKKISKPSKAKIIFDSSPRRLVKSILKELAKS